jgi:hypothetical protein
MTEHRPPAGERALRAGPESDAGLYDPSQPQRRDLPELAPAPGFGHPVIQGSAAFSGGAEL